MSIKRKNIDQEGQPQQECQQDPSQQQPNKQQIPARTITVDIRGQSREYRFLKTVNSMEKLEKIRRQVIFDQIFFPTQIVPFSMLAYLVIATEKRILKGQ
jgi:hypothetical protein